MRPEGIVSIALMATLLTSSLVGAQVPSMTASATSLTIEQAIENSLTKNAEILAIAHEIDAASGRALVADSLEPAQLTFNIDEISGARFGDAAAKSLELEQGLPFPGKRTLRREIAEFEIQKLRAQQRQIRSRLRANVTGTYYFARFQEERVQSIEASEALLSEFLQTTQSRFEAGRGTYLDVVRAKVELSRLRNDLLEARRELGRSKADLNLLMGWPGAAPFELSTPLEAPAEVVDEESAVSRVLDSSAVLEVARINLATAQSARRLAGKERLPDFNVLLSGMLVRDGDESTPVWGAGFGVSLPIWKAPTGMMREADANIGREESNLASLQRAVRTSAEQALETVFTTRAQVHLFQVSILDDIESELRAGIDAYRADQVDALNLIDIYRTYIESRIEYGRSLYLYLTALAQLEAAGDIEL